MQSCGKGLNYCVIWPVDSAGTVERLLDRADTEPMASGVRIPQEMLVEPVLEPPPGSVFACGILRFAPANYSPAGFFASPPVTSNSGINTASTGKAGILLRIAASMPCLSAGWLGWVKASTGKPCR